MALCIPEMHLTFMQFLIFPTVFSNIFGFRVILNLNCNKHSKLLTALDRWLLYALWKNKHFNHFSVFSKGFLLRFSNMGSFGMKINKFVKWLGMIRPVSLQPKLLPRLLSLFHSDSVTGDHSFKHGCFPI